MNHNTCTCSGCMESRALAAEREVERLKAENARLAAEIAGLREWLKLGGKAVEWQVAENKRLQELLRQQGE